jgi:hypothetical protein
MREIFSLNQNQRDFLRSFFQVFFTCLPLGYVSSTLDLPFCVVLIVVLLVLSSTGIAFSATAGVKGYGVIFVVFFTVVLMATSTWITYTQTLDGFIEEHFSTYAALFLLVFAPLTIAGLSSDEHLGLKPWYRQFYSWFLKWFWLFSLLILYLFSAALISSYSQEKLWLLHTSMEEITFDAEAIRFLLFWIIRVFNSVDVLDDLLALSMAWVSTVFWAVSLARSSLTRLFPTFPVSLIVILLGLAGFGSGYYIGIMDHL